MDGPHGSAYGRAHAGAARPPRGHLGGRCRRDFDSSVTTTLSPGGTATFTSPTLDPSTKQVTLTVKSAAYPMRVKKTPSGLTVSGKGKSLRSVLGPKVRIGVQSGLHAEESAAVTVSFSK